MTDDEKTLPRLLLTTCLLMAMALGATSASTDISKELPNLYEAFKKYASEDEQKMLEFKLTNLSERELFDKLLSWISDNLDEMDRVSTESVKKTCSTSIKEAKKSLERTREIIGKNQQADTAKILELIECITELHKIYNNAVALFMEQVLPETRFQQEIEATTRYVNIFICQILANIFEKAKNDKLITPPLQKAIDEFVKKLKNSADQKADALQNDNAPATVLKDGESAKNEKVDNAEAAKNAELPKKSTEFSKDTPSADNIV
jgi:hypothetical protein